MKTGSLPDETCGCCTGGLPRFASNHEVHAAKFYDPIQRQIEGCSVAVDPQLLSAANQAVLADAFHDEELGFNNRAIVDEYDQMKSEGIYDKVHLCSGRRVKHYGLNNHKEYLAESTEAYFGVNDFYPFVRAELREHDPRMFKLVERIWGEVK